MQQQQQQQQQHAAVLAIARLALRPFSSTRTKGSGGAGIGGASRRPRSPPCASPISSPSMLPANAMAGAHPWVGVIATPAHQRMMSRPLDW